ncbi:hypothetical protein NY547_12340 [Cnuibacter physcomitrellae]|uniref:hypothetical protein n=1 Tax=Cnuibacter physcomitrellae TaxID=1619308 RepID=UPI0021759C2C|nr:hypothetical protein [Cnuibacter physcomitrellae]MCS5498030.1 hypothetical protein [Cnuibacter physcomitrellae]
MQRIEDPRPTSTVPPHVGMRRHGRRLAALAVLVALAASGCASAQDTGPTTATAPASTAPASTASDGAAPARPTATAAPPEGITVTIDQQRLDIPLDMMSVQVHNRSGRTLEIVEATYTDARFAEPIQWVGDTLVPSDIQRDLRVPIPAPDCAAPAAAPAPHVEVTYILDDAVAVGEYTPTDPFDFVPLRVAADCFAERVAQTADVSLTGVSTRHTEAGEVVELQITVADHGADALTLGTISSTVLFQPADGSTGWTLDAAVAPGQSRVLTIDAIPSRCDAHALAEDKVGTRFDASVAVGDPGTTAGTGTTATTGTLTLVATDAQRSDLYAYFSDRCGLR